MTSLEAVVSQLKAAAKAERLEGMARYGISVENRLGVKVPEIRKIAKEIGKSHSLALGLWATEIADARILASLVDNPEKVTEAQMEAWVRDFNSWDVCDQVCMNLFDKTPFAWDKIYAWSEREEEFVKRAGFALIASLATHDKTAPNEVFIQLIPVIEAGATDERNYVKKAVSWALRNMGKRNPHLRCAALKVAENLRAFESKPARWIAADTIRDLNSEATLRRMDRYL